MADDLKAIQQALRETHQKLDKLTRQVEKIHRRMLWASIFGIIKILIVVVPLAYGIWYFREPIIKFYQSWDDLVRIIASYERGEQFIPREGVQRIIEQYLEGIKR